MSPMLAAWLYTHPRLRRVWLMFQLLWAGSLFAVISAPRAAADTLNGALSWTGLHDSYGIPIGAYFVSVVPMTEAISSQGPSFGVNPDTWGPALMSTLTTALTYTQLASWLAMCCATFLFIVSLGLWFIKFALGVTWLSWLAAAANPIVTNLQMLVSRLYLMPGAMMICAAVGGVVALTRGMGLGLGIIGGGLLVLGATTFLLQDPVSEMVSDNGVLGIGKSLGFMAAQGVVNNGPLATGGTAAQMDTLTSWLCDVLVRRVIQLINFGQVIDDIPGCAGVWNAALLGAGPTQLAPIHRPAAAIRVCAPSAYQHATQLDATTVGLFAAIIVIIGLVLLALDYIATEVFRVGFRAFWNLLVIVPAAAVAVAPGPARQFAKRTALKLVVHGVEMIFATAGMGIVVLLMAQATRGGLAGATGMTAPLAMLMVMLLIAVFGAVGFRALLRAFGDQGLPGPIRITRSAVSTTLRASRGVDHFNDVRGKVGSLRERLADRKAKTGQGQAEHADNSAAARPGRKPHPTPTATNASPTKTLARTADSRGGAQRRSSGGEPPSATTGTAGAQRRPGEGKPPAGTATAGGRGGGGIGAAASGQKSSVTTSAAARVAASAAAPEVAAGVKVAEAATHAFKRGAEKHPSPGRSGQTQATPQARTGASPTSTPARPSQQSGPPNPDNAGSQEPRAAATAPPGRPAPGRNTPPGH